MRVLLLVTGLSLLAATVHAQEPRVSVSLGVSLQPQTAIFTDRTTFDYNREEALAESDYRVKGGMAVDVSGRVRVWRDLGVGMSANRLSRSGVAVNTFNLPHPFFFNRDRQFQNEAPSRDLRQTVIHVDVSYAVVSDGPLELAVFGGPSYFKFRQDVVDTFEPREVYPFDAIPDVELSFATLTGSAMGFHVGVDVARHLTRHFGIGGLVRFTQASKTLSIGAGAPFDLSLGSVQVGGGARLRF